MKITQIYCDLDSYRRILLKMSRQTNKGHLREKNRRKSYHTHPSTIPPYNVFLFASFLPLKSFQNTQKILFFPHYTPWHHHTSPHITPHPKTLLGRSKEPGNTTQEHTHRSPNHFWKVRETIIWNTTNNLESPTESQISGHFPTTIIHNLMDACLSIGSDGSSIFHTCFLSLFTLGVSLSRFTHAFSLCSK